MSGRYVALDGRGVGSCPIYVSQEVSVDKAFMHRRRLSDSFAATSGLQRFSTNLVNWGT